MSKQLEFFLDPTSCEVITDPLEYFFNMVCACLLKETKYYADSDGTRDELIQIMDQISLMDPEFILQTAYYLRQRMYIRTCSNFIVAYSILNPNTELFVPRYFNSTVLIPGDLIEVCQFVQIIHLINQKQKILGPQDLRKKLYFPQLLRKCVQSKIQGFTLYQLGKQCSESNRKKTLKSYKDFFNPELIQKRREKRLAKLLLIKQQGELNEDIKIEIEKKFKQCTGKQKKNQKKHQYKIQEHQNISEKNIFDIKFVTMKDIIRFCHVVQPKELVMSILGKKYPSTQEEFEKTFYLDILDKKNIQFDPTMINKRMQVPIPITWERELSSKGKSPEVWANLIINNQLPYMATMRNIRNIILSQIPNEIHQIVINKIQNQKMVANAKMFPLQYYNAIAELDKLQKSINEVISPQTAKQEQDGRGRPQRQVKSKKEPISEEIKDLYQKIDQKQIENYKQAIENAIKISVNKNLDEIKGVTYVFCDVSGSMGCKISGGKKYGSISTCQDCAFILGLMIKQKCHQCEFYLFSNPQGQCKTYEKVEVDTDSLLEGMKRCQILSSKMGKSHEMIGETIDQLLLDKKIKADNVIILSDMMITQGFSDGNGKKFDQVIKEYINTINSAIKFFFIDISGYGKQVTFGEELKSKNCFTISGMSDNVLRYISLAENINQIDDVKQFSIQAQAQIKNINKQKLQVGDMEEESKQQAIQVQQQN